VVNYEAKNLDKTDYTKEVSLNPNHTHFLLCDDSTQDAEKACGQEIPLRVNLENELIKGKSLKDYLAINFLNLKQRQKCPLLLLVIKGGFNTLELIHSHQRKVPILVLVGTKGCADLIAQILQLSNEL
jgi:NifU-like protein involved in Fe-S cluster formation